ncbi:MAG TPA: hypothetical protein DCM40_16085, partial [Maribacter sp.]|nr:hypothetical protein [Maribacter sp.]
LLEWSQNLPVVENKNQELYENLLGGAPITSLVRDAKHVKIALAEAVNWALNEGIGDKIVDAAVGTLKKFVGKTMPAMKDTLSLVEQEQKRIIAIYPGRFQPMGQHHYQTYKALVDKFGVENTFIATSNVVDPTKGSPLSFNEKRRIAIEHGVPGDKIILTRNPYQATEITDGFDADKTSVVFAVGGKDMRESPRFANLDGLTKKGTDAYYKTYKPGEELVRLDKHGYITVAPHVEIEIPGFGEMSGTTLRKALKGATREDFEKIMGFYNQEIYDILQGKLEELSGSGAVGGFAGPLAMRAPKVVGSEKKKKKTLPEEEEIVTEVMDYLLGISVG